MSQYADRVRIWVTFNEPQSLDPSQVSSTNGKAVYNVLKSHTRLYHFYHDELKGNGTVTFINGASPGTPQMPNNASHLAAVEHYNGYYLGTFLNPLVFGLDYPEAYKMTIQDYVPLTPSDLVYMNGTMDIVAFDDYASQVIFPAVTDISTCASNNASTNPYYPTCIGITTKTQNSEWNLGFNTDYWIYATPKSTHSNVNYLYDRFKLLVMLTEFGLSTAPQYGLPYANYAFDTQRSEYLTFVFAGVVEGDL